MKTFEYLVYDFNKGASYLKKGSFENIEALIAEIAKDDNLVLKSTAIKLENGIEEAVVHIEL